MEKGATSAAKHFLKMEHQYKWINCKKAKHLEKLKEALKSKSGDNKLPCAYTGIKKSRDPTIAWPPI